MTALRVETVIATPKYGTPDGATGFVEVRTPSGELISLHFDASLFQPALREQVRVLWELAGLPKEEGIAAADQAQAMVQRCLAANSSART